MYLCITPVAYLVQPFMSTTKRVPDLFYHNAQFYQYQHVKPLSVLTTSHQQWISCNEYLLCYSDSSRIMKTKTRTICKMYKLCPSTSHLTDNCLHKSAIRVCRPGGLTDTSDFLQMTITWHQRQSNEHKTETTSQHTSETWYKRAVLHDDRNTKQIKVQFFTETLVLKSA